MPEDDITKKIRDATRFPHFPDRSYVDDPHYDDYPALYSLLVGAAIALIHCRKIIEETPFAQRTWSVFNLSLDLVLAIGENGVDWQRSENMSLWSIGFFLDKAQNNIAAALDGCINAWLLSKLPYTKEELEKKDIERELLGLWVGTVSVS